MAYTVTKSGEDYVIVKDNKIQSYTITTDNTQPVMNQQNQRPCLHDGCPSCDGTGIRKDGLGSCIHMISCSCPKCTPHM